MTHPLTRTAPLGLAVGLTIPAASACHPQAPNEGRPVVTVEIPRPEDDGLLAASIPDLDGDGLEELLEVPVRKSHFFWAEGWSQVSLSSHRALHEIRIANAAPHQIMGCAAFSGLCRWGLSRKVAFFHYDPVTQALETFDARPKLPAELNPSYVHTVGYELPPLFEASYGVGDRVYFKDPDTDPPRVASGKIGDFKIHAKISKGNREGGLVDGRIFSMTLYAAIQRDSGASAVVPFHELCGKNSKK